MNKLIQKSTSRAFMYPLVCFLFLIKRNVIAKSMDNLLPMQEKEKKIKCLFLKVFRCYKEVGFL